MDVTDVVLTDPAHPTLVLGADVVHPAPGSDGRPSFSAVVGNVDSDSAKYIATMQVQESRVEIIQDLEKMVTVSNAVDVPKYTH